MSAPGVWHIVAGVFICSDPHWVIRDGHRLWTTGVAECETPEDARFIVEAVAAYREQNKQMAEDEGVYQ